MLRHGHIYDYIVHYYIKTQAEREDYTGRCRFEMEYCDM